MNQSMTKLYSQDGTGRDSYIFFDNGGFYPGNIKLQQKPNLSKCNVMHIFKGPMAHSHHKRQTSNQKEDNSISRMELAETPMSFEMCKIRL